MSTSPVSPEDIRAAAEVHHELGPEYSDAVVASFLEKVDREVATRVEARLAAASRMTAVRRESRRSLLHGMVIGACAGALAATVAIWLPALHGQSAGGQPVSGVGIQVPAPKGAPLHAILTPKIFLPERPRPAKPRT